MLAGVLDVVGDALGDTCDTSMVTFDVPREGNEPFAGFSS